jgi:hypothetical protein
MTPTEADRTAIKKLIEDIEDPDDAIRLLSKLGASCRRTAGGHTLAQLAGHTVTLAGRPKGRSVHNMRADVVRMLVGASGDEKVRGALLKLIRPERPAVSETPWWLNRTHELLTFGVEQSPQDATPLDHTAVQGSHPSQEEEPVVYTNGIFEMHPPAEAVVRSGDRVVSVYGLPLSRRAALGGDEGVLAGWLSGERCSKTDDCLRRDRHRGPCGKSTEGLMVLTCQLRSCGRQYIGKQGDHYHDVGCFKSDSALLVRAAQASHAVRKTPDIRETPQSHGPNAPNIKRLSAALAQAASNLMDAAMRAATQAAQGGLSERLRQAERRAKTAERERDIAVRNLERIRGFLAKGKR